MRTMKAEQGTSTIDPTIRPDKDVSTDMATEAYIMVE